MAIDTFIVLYLSQVLLSAVLLEVGWKPVDHRPMTLLVIFAYFVAFWVSPLRSTPGQFLLGMRVVSIECATLSLRQAALRSGALIVLFASALTALSTDSYLMLVALPACLALFLAAATPNRQAGHDLIAGSMVVNRVALNSPEDNRLLHEHLAASSPRRPSIVSIFGNLLVLGVPMVLMAISAGIMKNKDLSYRTHYAVDEVRGLQVAVEDFHAEHRRLPQPGDDVAVQSSARYPAGGYYQLDYDGVIRIQFEIKPELKNGAILMTPTSSKRGINWQCRTEGNIDNRYLPRACRSV